ncbi:MAG TPA: shikimate dehydrogenase, partial [Mycobacteriales bacterium]|nr:shikimate dehydrogenase [Mycobacteriales bacterium]
VTVLGAGGTAQAVVAALAGRGVERCTVLVRDPGRTTALRDTAAAFDVTLEVAQLHAGAPALSAALVISTLPPRAADPLAAGGWTPGQMLLDVVYDPWPTAIADAVSAAGGRVISGAVMLLHQAARQVELMTGQAAPVEAMRTALRAAVPHAGAV